MTQYVKKHFLCINRSIVIFICLLSSILANATPAFPGYIDFRQPDGSIVKIKMMGDEYLRWAETEDGYSLLFDKSGYLVYADHDSNGDLVATSLRASEVSRRSNVIKNRLTKIGKKIMYSEKQIAKALEVRIADAPAPRRANALGRVINPVVGIRKNLVILVDFPDLPFTYTQQDFDVLMNSEHPSESMPSNASVRDYYREASFGQLDLQSTVVGVYRMPQPMAYYGSNSGSTDTHAREMIIEAINQADEDIDFSEFDNDGDGRVDGIHIIYAGYGEEAGGGSDCIWSHSSQLSGTVDGVSLGRYSCSPELRNNYGKSRTHIGVICHELGHVLGTMDFYDTNYGVDGSYPSTGQWDMMAQGNWNGGGAYPAFFNPYTVIYDFGWADAINGNKPSSMSLVHHNKNGYVRINTPTEGEYFLLEYRDKASFDIGIPGHGLMIYRASDNLSRRGQNTINAKHPQQFYPLAANAPNDIPTFDPSSYGVPNSESCAFPGALGVTEITDYTTPSMRTWAGLETGYPITNIEEDQAMHSVSFDISGGGLKGAYGLKVTDSGSDYVSLEWNTSWENPKIMLVYNSEATFGKPEIRDYSAGDHITGGGEVLYIGSGLSFKHTGLADRTNYYYTLFTWDETNSQWIGSLIRGGRTMTGIIRSFPYKEDFETGEIDEAWVMEKLVGANSWMIRKVASITFLSFDPEGIDDQMSTRMILPVMDFTGIDAATLSFEYSSHLESVDIQYRTSSKDEWHHLAELEYTNSTYYLDRCYHIVLPTLSSEYQISFLPNYNNHGASGTTSYHYFNIDNIEISTESPIFVDTQPKSKLGSRFADIPVKTSDGNKPVLEKGIYLYDGETEWKKVTVSDDDICHLKNLNHNQTYQYKAYALYESGETQGVVYQFHTLPFSNGEGTKEAPFKIQNSNDWILIKSTIAKQYNWRDKDNSPVPSGFTMRDVYFELDADIELSFNDVWAYSLSCSLDGKGHKITVKSYSEEDGVPVVSFLINQLNVGSVVKNLNICSDPNLQSYYVKNSLLCWSNNGVVDNCSAILNNEAKCHNDRDCFAVLITNNSGVISNCKVNCCNLQSEHSTVEGRPSPYVAGITCTSNGIVDGCTTRGALSGFDIAGIVGYSEGTVRNCINYASLNVPISARDFKGGGAIVNENDGIIECCVNYGTLFGCWTGGIAHINNSENSLITNCYNIGEYHKIEISDYSWNDKNKMSVAGIVRLCYGGGKINNCFFAGNVTGNFEELGGFAFCQYKDINAYNCYYYGDFNDPLGEKLSSYDLTSQDFAYNLNKYADYKVWCIDDGRVKLSMEVEHEQYFQSPFFTSKVSNVRSKSVKFEATIVGISIKESGIEWKELNSETWNRYVGDSPSLIKTSLQGLEPLHIYSYRLYAIDDDGNCFLSNEKQFATLFEDVTNTNDTLYISNLYSLKAFAMTVETNTYLDKVVMLTKDIDMLGNNGVLWEPIRGNFRGIFDGNGYTLNNMKVITDNKKYGGGLFATTGYCIIRNLGMRNAYVRGFTHSGGIQASGLARIDQCYFTGSVEAVGRASAFGYLRQCTSCYSFGSSIYSGFMDGNDNKYDPCKYEDCYVGSFGELNEDEINNGSILADLNSEIWAPDIVGNPINWGYPILKWQLRNSRVATQEVMWDDLNRATLIGTYIRGIGEKHTSFGFEWFEKRDNQNVTNVVTAKSADEFEATIDGFVSGSIYYYRAFAVTEEKDSIFGGWVEFQRKNGQPVPYIENFVQEENSGTVSFNVGHSLGDNTIVQREIQYYEKDKSDEATMVSVDDMSKQQTINDLKTHTNYCMVFRIKDSQGEWFESKPYSWLTPIFGVNHLSGDANDDGKISVSDIVTIVSEMRGLQHKDVNIVNADVHEDAAINKLDVLAAKDLLLTNTLITADKSSSDINFEVINDTLDIADNSRLSIRLNVNSNVTAMAFDLVLPSMTKVVDARVNEDNCNISHYVFYQQHNDTTTVVVYSWDNDVVKDTNDKEGVESAHIYLYLDDTNLPSYPDISVKLVNCTVVDKECNEMGLLDCVATLPITDPLLIDGIYYKLIGRAYDKNNPLRMMVVPLRIGEYHGDVLIPDSVTYLGQKYEVTEIGNGWTGYGYVGCPFENNPNITTLTIPGTINEIPDGLFGNCINLKDVVLNEGIKIISRAAFDKTSLTSLYIPASVEKIRGNLGVMNNLQRFEVSPNNLYYSSIGGHLHSKSGKTLVQCLPMKQLSYIVPEFVDTIGISAFNESFECNVIFLKDNIKATGQLDFGKSKYVVLESNELPELLTNNTWPTNQILFVKEELIDICKSLDRWMNYSKILPLKQNTLEFKKGWNWVSFNIISQETCDINSFAKVSEGVQTIESQTQALYNDPVLGWVGNLDFQPEQCYKISSKKDIEIPTLGGYCDYESKMLFIYPGWNWMPYWPSTPMYVSNAIDRYYGLGNGVVILGQDEFAVYNNNGWQGDFIMQPGKGYMIYSPSEDTDFMYYKYIAPEDIPTNAPTPPSAPESYWTYDAHAFANTMPVIAKVKDAPNPNYEVAAVVNEECRGVSRAADGKSLIAVHGETGETVRFHMYDRMNGVIYEVNEEIQFTNDLTGSFQEPLILTLGSVIGYSGEGTAVEKVVESKYSDVYSIEGVKLIDKATPEQIRNLPKGIYVINGRKVMK